VSQYWEGLILGALDSMAADAEVEYRKKIANLRDYRRFPLDKHVPGVAGLSADQFQKAREMLSAIGTAQPVEGGETLGEGASVELPGVDARVRRLRELGIDSRLRKWMRDARRLMDAFPERADRRFSCTVSIVPQAEQARLLAEFGKGDPRDASVLHKWAVVHLHVPGRRTKRHKTYQAKVTSVGLVTYPGDNFRFDFYTYATDKTPSRTVSFEGPWACVRMLHMYRSERMEEEPAKWHVQVPLKDDDGDERILWLRLEFDRPLPPLSDWPVYRTASANR
jgi:hypothetical protein